MTAPDKPRHLSRKRIKTDRSPLANACFSLTANKLNCAVGRSERRRRQQKFCSSCGEPCGSSGGTAWKPRAPSFSPSSTTLLPPPPPATLLVKVVTRRTARLTSSCGEETMGWHRHGNRPDVTIWACVFHFWSLFFRLEDLDRHQWN